MKCWQHLLLCALAIFFGGCGTTVKESLKVAPVSKISVGNERTAVVLPFADYSYADNLETAFRRNMFVNEAIIDHFVRLGFHLPVQEDVFQFLAQQNIINVLSYNPKKTSSVQREMDKEWSSSMKNILQSYIDYTQEQDQQFDEGENALTHGLDNQAVVKIGRHFSADYIVRGRIIQYKDSLDPSNAIWKKGTVPFFVGGAKNILLGKANSQRYDSSNSFDSDWDDLLSLGDVPQAVIQIRIWVQDAYTGHIVWTNRVNVEVSPQSFFADYQRDVLFETATEKAVTSLMNDFAYSVFHVPLPVVTHTKR